MREVVIALAAAALVASCTAGPTGGGGSPAATGSPTRKALDFSGDPRAAAPLTFDSKAAHVLPTGPTDDPTIALYGRAAWLAHASGRAGLTSRMDCDQGEGGTVVLCASKQDGVLAVDKAGKILWRRAAGDGPNDWSATVEADFKDLFYAKGKDGTFVVDGRTGRTVSADAGIVPDRINGYAALVYADTGAEVHYAKR
ncbi:hypothetical protein SBI_05515 [Streptomyces bingchenggensis BCW-1]|uniref:Pyrrolo-quinoline quinone n=1 Tax=Streptomyces bingchenggensis (strain BCW-1) TaxID=749414 RepID=D7CAR8_STRBB|nr:MULTISPECIES: hypothetical protein [Streptomyces]ADI08635.1 hypothetical protein SBI_05515 [Streptomyces bingchenggensis BCW-1]